MLTPETAAELAQIREAKRQARAIVAWERRVVRRAIETEGSTQQDVADVLEVSQQAVSKIIGRDPTAD